MWFLVILMLGFPTTSGGGSSFYTVVGEYSNRDACLKAQARFNHTAGVHHIAVRTACTTR